MLQMLLKINGPRFLQNEEMLGKSLAEIKIDKYY